MVQAMREVRQGYKLSLTMRLDCVTPRGQIATADQMCAVRAVLATRKPGTTFANTSLEGAAVVDGFFVNRAGDVVAVAEVKTREMTEHQFWGEFKGTWLITHQKLLDIQTISRLLVIPSYGILYLKPSGVVLFRQLTNKAGEFVEEFQIERTATQATCNGGVAHRVNAFIPMHRAHRFSIL